LLKKHIIALSKKGRGHVKDIDFDELDKAVSSVLGTKGDETPASPAPAASSTLPVGTPATASEPTPSVETTSPESPASTAPLAVKRRGKFMDVVHPSSDMNKTGGPSQPLLSPTAQKRLEPVSEPTPTPEPVAPTAEPEPVVLDEPKTEPTPFTLPDEPQDVTEPTKVEPPTEVASPVPSEEPATLPDEPKPESSMTMPDPLADFNPDETVKPTAEQDIAPVTTPFLEGAKVEKRPLGSFGDEQPVDPGSTEQPDTKATADLSQPPAVTLPRELQSDIVQVEATHEGTPSVSDLSAKVGSTAGTLTLNDDAHETAHPLFDTTNYHEPIAAASKKKGGSWMWILIGLLVCLAIGAGVGYFIYTAGL